MSTPKIVLALRRLQSPRSYQEARLHGLEREAEYEWQDIDSGETR
jgi:hypothetical protein